MAHANPWLQRFSCWLVFFPGFSPLPLLVPAGRPELRRFVFAFSCWVDDTHCAPKESVRACVFLGFFAEDCALWFFAEA
jgi:hypothetical protein